MFPHIDVHRGSHHHRRFCGEIKCGEEIVGNAAGHLGNHISRGGRHDQQIDSLRDSNVLDRAFHVGSGCLAAKHFRNDFVSRERRERQRGNELLRARGHHRLHFDAFLLEPAHQFGGLIRRHASGNTKCHTHGLPGALLLAPFSFLVFGLARNHRQLIFQNSGAQFFHGDPGWFM